MDWTNGQYGLGEGINPISDEKYGVYVLYTDFPVTPIYVGKGSINQRLKDHRNQIQSDPPQLREAYSKIDDMPILFKYIQLTETESSNLENKLYHQYKQTLFNLMETEGDGRFAPDVINPL